MITLTLLLLAIASVYANSVCYLPAYDQLQLTFVKEYVEKENDKDKAVRCYSVKHKYTPTKENLYSNIQCGKEYYVASFSNTIGSFNSLSFPSDKYAVTTSPTYEDKSNQVEGKLRAIKMTAQKEELNKEIIIEGEICVQKIPDFKDGDQPIAILRFVPSDDLESDVLVFNQAANSPGGMTTGQTTTTTTQNGNLTVKQCKGQGNVLVECSVQGPNQSVKVIAGGDSNIVIVTSNSSGRKLLL